MNKVFIVGHPLLEDVLARASKPETCRSLYADLALSSGESFLLFNVEPSAEHHYCDWEKHWQNFRAMMSIVTKQGLPVVLSLHPLCSFEDYAFAEREFGVRISRRWKIYDLYPHCKFVVSFPCSTNLMAETFCKPLVIYDFFLIAHPNSPRVNEFRLPSVLVGHTYTEIAANIMQIGDLAASSGKVATTSVVPTFEKASEVIRHQVESLLKERDKGAFTCAN
jgi:hypothetical protein